MAKKGGAIGSLFISLGLDSAQFGAGLKGAESNLAKFGRTVKKGMAVAATAAAAAATGIGLAVKGTIDAADAMAKASQKFGVPIEELSRLKHAADLSGISFEGMGTGLRRLSQNMNDASNGVGEGLDAFNQLGISVTDADGKLKSTTAVMAEMADKFAAMPDGAEKTALAMDLMGRSGTDMIPLLNGGSEALRGMLAEADQFGQVFTQELGSSAEAFNDNMTRLKGTFGSLAAAITKDMLPHLEAFSQWLIDNAPQIRAFASTAIQGFVDLVQVLGTVGSAVAKVIGFFQSLDEFFRGLGERMRELGGQIIQGLWDGMKAKFQAVKDSVTGFASDLVGGIKAKLGIQSPSKVMHEIGINIMEGLRDGMGSMAQDLSQTVSSALQGVIAGATSAKDAIKGLLKDLAQLAINRAFQSLFGGAGGGAFGSLFAGFFANGGHIPRGQFGVVGERGPEFVAGPAHVTPMGSGGVGSVTMHVNIDARGAERGVEAKIGAALEKFRQGLPRMVRDDMARGRV